MKEKIAAISILANITLAGSKIIIGVFSNSTAVLASGIDSLIDIFSSMVSYIGIKISKKPADEKHPYGHHKFEVLGGVIITIIILITGIGIIYEAYQSFLKPENIKINYMLLGVMLFSVAINEVMARLKIHYGKKESSVVLLSDGVHSRIDVYTSLAVLLGLFLTEYWIYADTVLTLLIGFYIIKNAFSIGKEAIGSLLDISADKETEEKIKSIAKNQNIGIDSLKTQKKGSAITANLDIKLPSNLTVDKATEISNNLREKLMQGIQGLEYIAIQITSHEVGTGFYKPDFEPIIRQGLGIGRGFNWRTKGRFKDENKQASGRGPNGYCVCEKCGYKTPHQRGIPCSDLKCPKCGTILKRE